MVYIVFRQEPIALLHIGRLGLLMLPVFTCTVTYVNAAGLTRWAFGRIHLTSDVGKNA